MIKKINIEGNEYTINSNAYTRFLYKKLFGTGIMEDLQKLSNFANQINKETTDYKGLDDFLDVILQITYTLIKCADSNFMPYEEWLKSLDSIDISNNWVAEVTEIAVSSFYRSGTSGANPIN